MALAKTIKTNHLPVSDITCDAVPDENIIKFKKIEKAAVDLRSDILNMADKKDFVGKVWYVSPKGKSDNSGESMDSPWDSLDTLMKNSHLLSRGDSVLLQRGELYRGQIIAVSGVYYGAYGEGEKPLIYGSLADYSKYKWINEDENIWRIEHNFRWDVGIVSVNCGESIGFKKSKRAELQNDFDFWCDAENGYKLYMYISSDFDFQSIEIGENINIIDVLEDCEAVTIENLSLKYGGAHGIRCRGNNKNITVRGCEISYIGGSYISGYSDGTVRYGNAVEFWQGCENILVERNWIHDIYDSGITHQGHGNYLLKNYYANNNLIERCGMGSIEYWLWCRKDALNRGENVTYQNNIMRLAGYGFGGKQRKDKEKSAHIQSNGLNHNNITNYKIIDNIFDRSAFDLVEISSLEGIYPSLRGNTYIQLRNQRLGTYGDYKDNYFTEQAEKIIRDYWGDKEAEIIYL